MTTEDDFIIREVEYESITTWWAAGQIDRTQFLLALLEQFNDSLTDHVRDDCRVPKLSDVTHSFGMGTECMDGAWIDASQHKETCEDPETCDFDLAECKWMTLIWDEQLLAPPTAREGTL
jgi:hypothetical protein